MLTELVSDLISDARLRAEFAKDAAGVFDKYDVSPADRAALRDSGATALQAVVGSSLATKYHAAMADIIVRPFYPGTPHLVIGTVTLGTQNSASTDLTIAFGHDSDGGVTPQYGLPTWMQVRIFDSATGANIDAANPGNAFAVPSMLDFINNLGLIKREQAVFPKAGDYNIVLDAAGSREVQASAPYKITVNF